MLQYQRGQSIRSMNFLPKLWQKMVKMTEAFKSCDTQQLERCALSVQSTTLLHEEIQLQTILSTLSLLDNLLTCSSWVSQTSNARRCYSSLSPCMDPKAAQPRKSLQQWCLITLFFYFSKHSITLILLFQNAKIVKTTSYRVKLKSKLWVIKMFYFTTKKGTSIFFTRLLKTIHLFQMKLRFGSRRENWKCASQNNKV